MTTTRSREHFARVREAFEELVDLDLEAREERLRLLGSTEPALAHEVVGLLAAASGAPAFLERPAEDVSLEGRSLGAWRIEARIGSAGMGDVYLASRVADDRSWRAAVKVLRGGLDGAALLEMFRRERRTLAALAHPNIVSLLDMGALEDGRPYFVMELVQGSPIDRHCAEAGLDLSARIELFLVVCSAVEHAHQRLVVHCDLKPANVLVTREGHPKLLDFGIAELLTTSGSPHPLPITPGYSSPEQVRGESITIASDVWSLGVLLYELLTGQHPFPDGARLPGAGLAAAELLLPSQAALHGTRERASVPVRWAKSLRGDLDAIASKALALSPDERYSSVGELARDLRAYLAGRAVAARRSTPALRFSRFARRNPLAALASGAAAVFLALSLVLTIRELVRARGEAHVGWSAHAQAVEVTRLLEELLLESERSSDPGDDRLERALDRAVARVGDSFTGSPETLGRLRITFGALYLQMDRAEKARAQLEEALALASSTRGFGGRDVERAQELLERSRADN